MSVQRRRGQPATVWATKEIVDNRGNAVIMLDEDNPIPVRAAFIPQRSGKAEVPGQQQINVTRMIVDAHVEGVTLWSRVQAQGRMWDVVTPPSYHHGDRRTRHWSIDIRERP
ncbi:phage head-tail adapter protein [Streptomyces sp. NBC_00289]|uniref:phage head-tail adapter protein n=1 Tax=Streptomyces sp. NBC_00289 TaxID=2975703 RepID=UPI003245B3B6